MKRPCKIIHILLLLIVALSVFMSGCSMSSNNYVGKEDNYGDRVPRKLGRGMTNIFSAPLEIPNQAVDLAAGTNEPAEQAAGYLGGIFVGLFYGTGRIASGMYDIVTCPFGGPATPTMEPEMISSEFIDKVDRRNEEFTDVSGLGD